MEFFNKKEEVIDIKLTQFGKNLLAKGKFKPVFYQFFDDDIIYNSNYAGFDEHQNHSETRIIEETPKLKTQSITLGVETKYIIENHKEEQDKKTKNQKQKESFKKAKEKPKGNTKNYDKGGKEKEKKYVLSKLYEDSLGLKPYKSDDYLPGVSTGKPGSKMDPATGKPKQETTPYDYYMSFADKLIGEFMYKDVRGFQNVAKDIGVPVSFGKPGSKMDPNTGKPKEKYNVSETELGYAGSILDAVGPLLGGFSMDQSFASLMPSSTPGSIYDYSISSENDSLKAEVYKSYVPNRNRLESFDLGMDNDKKKEAGNSSKDYASMLPKLEKKYAEALDKVFEVKKEEKEKNKNKKSKTMLEKTVKEALAKFDEKPPAFEPYSTYSKDNSFGKNSLKPLGLADEGISPKKGGEKRELFEEPKKSVDLHVQERILLYPLGSHDTSTEKAPRLKIMALDEKFEEGVSFLPITASGIRKNIPQLSLTSSFILMENRKNLTNNSFVNLESFFDLSSREMVFADNSKINVSGKSLLVNFEEYNVFNGLDNFELEIYEVTRRSKNDENVLVRIDDLNIINELFHIRTDADVQEVKEKTRRKSNYYRSDEN